MSESIRFRISRDRKRAAEREVESWPVEHDLDLAALDVEEIVQECLSVHESDRQVRQLIVRRLLLEKVKDVARAKEQLREIFDSSLRLFEAVGQRIRQARQLGFRVAGVAEFERAADETSRWREEVQRWPEVDEGMLQRSLAAYERGEHRPIAEFFDELHRSAQ